MKWLLTHLLKWRQFNFLWLQEPRISHWGCQEQEVLSNSSHLPICIFNNSIKSHSTNTDHLVIVCSFVFYTYPLNLYWCSAIWYDRKAMDRSDNFSNYDNCLFKEMILIISFYSCLWIWNLVVIFYHLSLHLQLDFILDIDWLPDIFPQKMIQMISFVYPYLDLLATYAQPHTLVCTYETNFYRNKLVETLEPFILRGNEMKK